MEHEAPKTRTEIKKQGKKKKGTVYSTKHVRISTDSKSSKK